MNLSAIKGFPNTHFLKISQLSHFSLTVMNFYNSHTCKTVALLVSNGLEPCIWATPCTLMICMRHPVAAVE